MRRLELIQDWVQRARQAEYRSQNLATVCFVSGSQLRRHFAYAYGLAPQDWLDELRLWHAMELLCEGQLVKEVAAKLSFGNASHLCHRFRQYHGCTPNECVCLYRRRVAEAQARGSIGEEVAFPWRFAERRLVARVTRSRSLSRTHASGADALEQDHSVSSY